VSFRRPIAKLSGSEPWSQSWPEDDLHAVVPLKPEPIGMDEFGSEHPQAAGPAAAIEEVAAENSSSRDERAFRIVTTVALVESVLLIVAGLSLSGILGSSTGTIVVETASAAAPASSDRVAAVTAPPVAPDLTPGSHVVSVSGGSQASRSIDMAAGRQPSVQVPLPERPAGGWISVSVPTAFQVFDSGQFVGTTGDGPIALAEGTHELEFVNEELDVRLTQRLMVQPGLTTVVAPALPRGSLAINARPWAEVWLNDELAGETPLGGLSLPVGRYEVLLRHPEFGERKTHVLITASTPARVHVDMSQRPEAP
jgi:hypothetical protein